MALLYAILYSQNVMDGQQVVRESLERRSRSHLLCESRAELVTTHFARREYLFHTTNIEAALKIYGQKVRV